MVILLVRPIASFALIHFLLATSSGPQQKLSTIDGSNKKEDQCKPSPSPSPGQPVRRVKRSYAERTASRRRRTDRLLKSMTIAPDSTSATGLDATTTTTTTTTQPPSSSIPFTLEMAANQIPILDAPAIDWSSSDVGVELDPMQQLQHDTPRSRRKRVQVEAFVHLCRELLLQEDDGNHNDDDDDDNYDAAANGRDITIVDAGSGAGNLAVPLAGMLQQHVLAIDINPFALKRLEGREFSSNTNVHNNKARITTQCADLNSAIALPPSCKIVCSLHACGAATDMAIRLATQHRAAFVMSPCCTGKANIVRPSPTTTTADVTDIGADTRSGAPEDITYPRSKWLRGNLLQSASQLLADDDSKRNRNDPPATAATTTPAGLYVTLAKVADVGLGPQTPAEQRLHQRWAKYAVEMDRLMEAVEEHEYTVQLYRLKDHEGYGKAEIYVGVPNERSAVKEKQKQHSDKNR